MQKVRVRSLPYCSYFDPISTTTGSPARMTWSEGVAWGSAELGPAATISGKGTGWLPFLAHEFLISQASSSSVIPACRTFSNVPQGGFRDSNSSAMRSISWGSFKIRSDSNSPSTGTRSIVARRIDFRCRRSVDKN